MWLNILLFLILLAVFGAVANRIVGGNGGLLHNTFSGGCGFFLSYIIRLAFFPESLHILWIIAMNLAATCVAVWVLQKVRIHMVLKKIRALEAAAEAERLCPGVEQSDQTLEQRRNHDEHT
jgi:hypothetical protein